MTRISERDGVPYGNWSSRNTWLLYRWVSEDPDLESTVHRMSVDQVRTYFEMLWDVLWQSMGPHFRERLIQLGDELGEGGLSSVNWAEVTRELRRRRRSELAGGAAGRRTGDGDGDTSSTGE